MEEQKYCLVQFKYTCSLEKDEEVRVVGSPSELGSWDVNKSEKMLYSKLDTPLWKTKENIKIIQNSTVEYKYVIFKNGTLVRWENLPYNKNRSIEVGNNIRIVVDDKQDDPNSKIEKSDCIYSRIDSTPSPKNFSMNDFYGGEGSQNIGDNLNNYFDNNNNAVNINSEFNFDEPNTLNEEYNDLNYESNDEAEETFTNKKTENVIEVNDKDTIIMCSFYLPFNVVREKDNSLSLELSNDPLYHTLFRLIEGKKNIKWFGCLKNYLHITDEEREKLALTFKEKNMFIIDLDKDIFQKNLTLFKEILEPLFHYISLSPSIIEDFAHFDIYWEAYKKFNEKLCDIISPHLKESTLIYLHDYHFFLVPSYIYSRCCHAKKKVFQNLSIGLFMHSPFPSHELFKRIPFREEILKSMMNCSVIGFHTFDYSRNFLKSAKRLLSINYESTINGDLAVNYYEHKVIVRVKNATPEIDLVKKDFNSEEFKTNFNMIKSKYEGKCIYVSLDHLKFLSGIKNKLKGYKKFLENIRGNTKQNVYLQYIRCSSDDLDQNGELLLDSAQKEMLAQIDQLASDIKKEFGDETIEVIKKKITYTERLAIFASANCFIRSSKQESFSLGIYEFLILKQLLKQDSDVSYMVSELSGVNTSLAGTIKINPFDYNSIYNGFLQAYQPVYDKEKNNITKQKDYRHVMKSSLNEWFNSFLRDIKNTKLTDENTYYLGVGEGLNFKLMKINNDFKKLNTKDIIPQYEKSTRRLLFFDYEGTLPSSSSSTETAESNFQSKGTKPSQEILALLEDLASDKHNTVFIVTGREAKLVNEWFGSVKDLGLAAEHGFMYKFNNGKENKWTRMIKNYNNEWITACVDILEPYTERCEGSFLEIKEASVVWQYRDCDQELGKSFATVITSELECSVKKLNLKVINGKGYVEVIAMGINKGSFVSYIIKENLTNDHLPDFILCVGDDTTDEKMFHYLRNKEKDIRKYIKNVKINTVTVGKKPSDAMYYVNNSRGVQEMIGELVKSSHKMSASYSTMNIRGMLKDKKLLYNLDMDDKILEETDS